MDQEFQERMKELNRLLAGDDICRVYAESARELETALADLMCRLPEEDRKILTGLRECTTLLRLREHTLICETMRFADRSKTT